jgi:hypothetical protein
MSRARAGAVRDARPPERLVHLGNPVVRTIVRSPAGRAIGALALIDHRGRRTGAPRRVVAAWHELGGRPFVLSPAPWRANFTDPAPARVVHRGRHRAMTGTLDADPERVAATLRACLAAGASPKSFGLAVEAGHEITAGDVVAVRRAIVWFEPAE